VTTEPGWSPSSERPPLDEAALRAWAGAPGSGWRELRVVDETGSTNDDLAAAARSGEAAGLVLVSEWQRGGHGRLGRSWTAPPRSGLTFSVLLRPTRPPAALGWLPLLAGLAVVDGVEEVAELRLGLKWPNDVLHDERKLAGLLAERVQDAVVVGIGLNVSLRADELPVQGATSLALAGRPGLDRSVLLTAVLGRLAAWVARWEAGDDQGTRSAYRSRCLTIGRTVRADQPGGQAVSGTAVDVDADGRLVVETTSGPVAVAAADVRHLR